MKILPICNNYYYIVVIIIIFLFIFPILIRFSTFNKNASGYMDEKELAERIYILLRETPDAAVIRELIKIEDKDNDR